MDSMSYFVSCQVDSNVQQPWGLIGCGLEGGVRPIGMRRGSCASLPHALPCRATSRWTCGPGGLDTASSNGETGGGVLCCPQ